MKPTVYIETTIVSYLTSRPSRDLVVAGHQQMTDEWWNEIRPNVQCVISPFVLQEAARGDQKAAQKRLKKLQGIPVLSINEEIKELAAAYLKAVHIPEKSSIDAFHLAFPAWYEVDYLLTWNCKHIASGRVRNVLAPINQRLNINTPIICTPEELMEV